MLSNCKFKYDYKQEIRFQMKGESMTNYTRYSLLDGDALVCSNEDMITPLIDGKLQHSNEDVFVFDLLDKKPIAAIIKENDHHNEMLTLSFLNSDAKEYPYLYLGYDNIKAVYKLTEVHRPYGSMNNLGPAL